jgi:hypothetical protein
LIAEPYRLAFEPVAFLESKDSELIQYATEIKVRAERRCGELLARTEKNTGARMNGGGDAPVVERCDRRETPTLADMGLSKSESSRYQQLAAMPPEHFETDVPAESRDVVSGPPPVSTSDIAAAFADIKWTREDWPRNLGKGDATSDWLESALIQRGRPGRGRPSTWDPVRLGSLLVQKGIPGNDGAPPPTKTDVARMLRDRFATVPCLRAWHRAWLSQEESLREYEVIK